VQGKAATGQDTVQVSRRRIDRAKDGGRPRTYSRSATAALGEVEAEPILSIVRKLGEMTAQVLQGGAVAIHSRKVRLGGLSDPRQVQVVVKVSNLNRATDFISGGAHDEFRIGFVIAARYRFQCGEDFIRCPFRAQGFRRPVGILDHIVQDRDDLGDTALASQHHAKRVENVGLTRLVSLPAMAGGGNLDCAFKVHRYSFICAID